MKNLHRFCCLTLIGILSFSFSPDQASAQGLSDLGLRLDLPSDWELVSSTTDRLPEFGMYVVQSERGGGMWMNVHSDSDKNRLLNRLPLPLQDEGIERAFLEIDNSAAIPGFLDGYIIKTNGYEEYFFKSLHNELVYDFRIGFWGKQAKQAGMSAEESNQALAEILSSLEFIK